MLARPYQRRSLVTDARRREFLRAGLTGLGLMACGPVLTACGGGGGSSSRPGGSRSAFSGIGPLQPENELGLRLPPGFGARVVARSGEIVPGSLYPWHIFPDGGATYPTEDGGWIYVSNSEVPLLGGVGALRFDRDGAITAAYPLLAGTTSNCAGGRTPWGTWLSCEEYELGTVWECDPFGQRLPLRHLALGTFAHEAVAVDPQRMQLYLTEDEGDGRLYRFTPDAYPDLGSGILEVAQALGDDPAARRRVLWHELPNPNPVFPLQTPTRQQVAESTAFDGGEGIWYHQGIVYFATKGDSRVWAFDTSAETLELVYDGSLFQAPVLTGVDNVVVSRSGDVLVAEDGGDMQIVALTPDRRVLPIVQVVGQDDSEITGPAFSPDGRRLYFSSQRGPGLLGPTGITYELTLPFSA